jgi:hypothetical protein
VRVCRAVFCAAIAWAVMPADASAQVYISRDVPRGGMVEIGGGVVWSKGYDVGTAAAEETRNTGSGPGPFLLFSSDTRNDASIGLRGRLGFYLSKSLSIEGGALVARPKMSTRLTGDAESAPDLTATETLTQLIIDGSVVLHLTSAAFGGGRGVPFVFGGAGYVRDAHEKNEVIETGHEFHAGGGLHYWLGQGKHRWGVRGDVGVSWRNGGADASDTTRVTPTLAGSVAYLF